ncbi:hypothetical protein TNCV_4018221 [Trichonephila clavipes]|nr:hypothetical protein TNCV_4018221 [Trichonephila clavipes]
MSQIVLSPTRGSKLLPTSDIKPTPLAPINSVDIDLRQSVKWHQKQQQQIGDASSGDVLITQSLLKIKRLVANSPCADL